MGKLYVPPCIVVRDSREPHPDAGDSPEAIFRPRVIGPGQSKDTPPEELGQIELPCTREKLDVGDYSLPGLTHMVALERKSGPDLLATLYGETTDSVGEARKRQDAFRAELERAYNYSLFAIVCEASVGWLYAEARRRRERYGKSFSPINTLALLRSFAVDLRAPTIWCGSKGSAELEVGSTLARVWEQACGGEASRKARKRGYALPWLDVLHPAKGGEAVDPREIDEPLRVEPAP